MKFLLFLLLIFFVYSINAQFKFPSSEKMLADLKEAGMSEANINKLNKIYEDYLTKRAEIKAKTRKG
ncbi:hypothetical protein CRE_08914 [Caenorhabditis remanei]|uniref:Uncharacterized protein n=1 Tax=Caenorhabditis remanei TaxID=31234 RepID=E3LI95_CAERE|nr:hypothetical protein CRE_08914 [Caenorhabditis remanei]